MSLLRSILTSLFLINSICMHYLPANNQKQLNASFESFGSITEVSIQNNQLTIKGEIVPFTDTLVNGFHVHLSDQDFYIPHQPILWSQKFTLNTPSLTDDQLLAAQNTLMTVTPSMNDVKSHAMYYVFKPFLPIPSNHESLTVGHGDFLRSGETILGLLVERGNLKPTDSVLDVGCGLGRAAYPLSLFLEPEGKYEGFDIELNLVLKAQLMLSPYYANFNFKHADIYNSVYNPNGQYLSSQFRFPYEDQSFDFIFLTSVFTHMLPIDVRHYLSEIERVLKPGGTCLATCFLIDKESKQIAGHRQHGLKFAIPYDECLINNKQFPEAAVAFEKKKLFQWINQAQLSVEKVYRGNWCGKIKNYTSFQDMIILKKESF